MTAISKPATTFAITSSPKTVENAPQRILIVGQQIDDTSPDAVLVKNIGNAGQENTLFGRRSMIASMIRAFKKINTVSQVDAIPLNQPAFAAAEGDVVFTGTATENGTLTVNIQSKKLFSFSIPIAIGATAADISKDVQNIVNDNDDILVIVDGETTAGTAIIDASFIGLEGNFISIEVKGVVAGITYTISAMSGGTGAPTTSGIFAQLGDIRYQTIVWPGSYSKDDVTGFLDPRFNPTGQILDGVAIASKTDSEADLISFVADLNSESYVLLGNKEVSITNAYEGQALFEFDPDVSAQFAAARTLRLTPNQNIASLLVNGGLTNAFGGPSRAATPYFNTPFPNIEVIEQELGWTLDEQNALNAAGVSFLGNNTALNEVIAGGIVTTYLTNTNGNDDVTFKFLNYVDTASNVREFFWNNNKSQYAQTVLTDGDLVPGIRMTNANAVESFQTKLYSELTARDDNGVLYALTQAGTGPATFFEQNLTVITDIGQGLISISAKVPIVTQVREIDGTLQIVFDINSQA